MGGGKGDTGYRIYTFQGRELYRKPIDRLIQFKWRPRMPVKLPDETIRVSVFFFYTRDRDKVRIRIYV